LSTKRSTFQKRQRETDLKDKARAKEARRAAKRDREAPDPEAAQEAERAQEAEILAAIAATTAATATIEHDARRAANSPSAPGESRPDGVGDDAASSTPSD
jgi:hypothetical protein